MKTVVNFGTGLFTLLFLTCAITTLVAGTMWICFEGGWKYPLAALPVVGALWAIHGLGKITIDFLEN